MSNLSIKKQFQIILGCMACLLYTSGTDQYALYKILLYKRIHAQDRQHGDNDSRHLDGLDKYFIMAAHHGLRLGGQLAVESDQNIPEINLQRLDIFIADIQVSIPPFVPPLHCIKQQEGCHKRLGNGNKNTRHHHKFISPVYPCLLYTSRCV